MERAAADVGLIFVAYNLKRIITIVGTKRLKVYLKALALLKTEYTPYKSALGKIFTLSNPSEKLISTACLAA